MSGHAMLELEDLDADQLLTSTSLERRHDLTCVRNIVFERDRAAVLPL